MELESKRKTFITNIRKHLETLGATFEKASQDSNSVYLKYNDIRIRVSDHFSPIKHKGMNIIVCTNNAKQSVVNTDGGVLVYNSIGELKTFLKHWCDISVCFNFGEISELNTLIAKKQIRANELTEEIRQKSLYSDKLDKETLAKEKRLNYAKVVGDALVSKSKIVLTEKQKARVVELIGEYAMQNEKAKTNITNKSKKNCAIITQ